jgi:hypothetical protein
MFNSPHRSSIFRIPFGSMPQDALAPGPQDVQDPQHPPPLDFTLLTRRRI